jgi:hypothetical protein
MVPLGFRDRNLLFGHRFQEIVSLLRQIEGQKNDGAVNARVCGEKACQFAAIFASSASSRTLQVVFSDTYPSSLFCSLRFCSAPSADQFRGSGNNAIFRNIAANRVLEVPVWNSKSFNHGGGTLSDGGRGSDCRFVLMLDRLLKMLDAQNYQNAGNAVLEYATSTRNS